MILRPTSCFRLLLLILTSPALAWAQASLSVNSGVPVRTVDERVFGVNAVLWDGNTATPQTISLLQAADVRTIRIPGGSLSDEYHWRTNTTLANTWNWAAGFDKYATLISGLNAQAFVTVNYGTGTPQEAAAWVAYANAPANILGTGSDVAIGVDSKGYDWKTAGYWSALRNSAPLATNDGMNFLRIGRLAPLGLKYWEIGNENYGTWESDEQAVQHDPYTYANRSKDYIAKMKAVDPTIKIGVVVQATEDDNINNTSHPAANPRTGLVHNGWTPVMLATLKAAPTVIPDYVIYHRYEQAPKADAIGWGGEYESDAGLLQKAKTWPTNAASIRQMVADYLGAGGAGVELIVTENNSVYGKPGKQTTSLVNGLYYADSIGNILQTEFNGLVWWDLRNGQENVNNNDATLYGWRQYGDYGILSSVSAFGSATAYDPYPTYYAFKLMSNFARGGDTVVSASSNNTLLTLFAAKRSNGTLSLLVINKDPTNTLSANIALTGFQPKATATTYTYGKPQDTAAQTGSGSTDIATGSISVGGATFSASFAPYSLTVITLEDIRVPPAITAQPASQTVVAGNPVTFTVGASGDPAPTYQWKKDNVAIVGATGSSYTIANVLVGDAGNYAVVATNPVGLATSNAATLTVNVAPTITTDPVNRTVLSGTGTTFAVTASGTPAPTYQWQRLPAGGGVWADLGNGGNYANVTAATLAVSSTTDAMNGDQFRCVATNSAATATSAAATLTVTALPPVITTEPTSRTVLAGTNVTFSVIATSAVPLTYQWYKDSVAIAGATSGSHAIPNVQSDAVGAYSVVVTNSGGTATSAVVTLSLGTIPAGFDVNAYLTRYPAVAAIYASDPYGAWVYYRDHGIYDGEVYDDLFRVEEYLTLYPTLAALFGDDLGGALVHWLTIGRIEGKLGRIPLEFSATGYFTRNPDVATAVNNDPLLAWGHYWLYGIYEGRAYDEELRVFEYLAINADLTAAFVNDWRQAALHWMRYGRTEGRLGRLPLIFNVTEYLNRSPDVAATWGTNPTTVFLHYWAYGIDEGRTFDDLFRPQEYLALNPDLAAIFGTDRRGAFKHWVRYGQAEGRPGKNP